MASCIAALSPPSSANPDENDHGVLHAGGSALLERAEHGARRDDDDGEIDRLADIGDRRITFKARRYRRSSD